MSRVYGEAESTCAAAAVAAAAAAGAALAGQVRHQAPLLLQSVTGCRSQSWRPALDVPLAQSTATSMPSDTSATGLGIPCRWSGASRCGC